MNKIKILLMVVIFISTSSLTYAQYLKDLSLYENITAVRDSNQQTQSKNTKSPLFAGSLSFIVPGLALGQFYNEQYFKGILHIGISGLGFGMFLSAMNPGGSSNNTSIGYAGFLLYLSNWIYTIFDAMASAENINRQIMLQKYKTDIMDKMKFVLTLNKNKQLNLKLAFEL